ncbi:TetR/AcrR family transcriptional regulator [Amycolatopsis jejuensis]|uniref:TetR/AcrR family transcriptional regulator n=1 Tax=Amycolatopsis jejuensis TaxID=330084 RepID=UPI000525B5DD|nr:TetR/AcrR family transcriptional regulator [Amycolatopsis jejuensis]
MPEERPYHHGNLRTALLDAAERGLRERGADQLSLRDLAREIGVSHAAPRRHFADRQALLDALAETGFLRLGTVFRTALAEADDFPSRVHGTASAFAHFAVDNPELLELMNSSKHRTETGPVTRSAEAAFGQMAELIHEGQAHGDLAPGDPDRIGIILYATVQGIAMMVNNKMIGRDQLDSIVEAAIEQFLHGTVH